MQLAVSDLVVEGTLGEATTSPVHGVVFDVRRTVAGAAVGARLVVEIPGDEASLRHADLAGPRGTALLLLLQRARPTDAAFTLVTSFDLARVEAAGLALDGRPGAAADHVEGVAFFARLAGDRDAPARDAARWAEGLQGANAFLQQNLLLRVDGYATLGLSTDAVVARVRSRRAPTAAGDVAARGRGRRARRSRSAPVGAGPRVHDAPGPRPRRRRQPPRPRSRRASRPGTRGRRPRVAGRVAPWRFRARRRAWALVGDPSVDDPLRAVALVALGEVALASAPRRAELRARDDLTALLRTALARPALRAAALEALEAIHHDARHDHGAQRSDYGSARWGSAAGGPPSR